MNISTPRLEGRGKGRESCPGISDCWSSDVGLVGSSCGHGGDGHCWSCDFGTGRSPASALTPIGQTQQECSQLGCRGGHSQYSRHTARQRRCRMDLGRSKQQMTWYEELICFVTSFSHYLEHCLSLSEYSLNMCE